MTTKQSFEVIINNDNFDLTELTSRINFYHIKGDLTDEDRLELLEAARSKAQDTITIDTRNEILEVWTRITSLENRVTALENAQGGGEGSDEDDPTPVDEWPEFVQPTGAFNAYQVGDKVTYQGTHYTCLIANCVWAPDIYPAGWQEEA